MTDLSEEFARAAGTADEASPVPADEPSPTRKLRDEVIRLRREIERTPPPGRARLLQAWRRLGICLTDCVPDWAAT